MAPYLSRIDLYPVKSLDGMSVAVAEILTSGALRGDRQYALMDTQGRYVNAKRTAKIHCLRAQFEGVILLEGGLRLTLRDSEAQAELVFDLQRDRAALEGWLSQYFEMSVVLKQDLMMGFPDDTKSPGPTIVSTATLEMVGDWFGWSLAETRSRFRTNLEIGGVPAFWEDQLFGAAGERRPFRIGSVDFWGINPCLRCPVPSRNPWSGEVLPQFAKQFMEQRARTLPTWVDRSRFDTFYRLAVNTQVPATEAGKQLQVGDKITL